MNEGAAMFQMQVDDAVMGYVDALTDMGVNTVVVQDDDMYINAMVVTDLVMRVQGMLVETGNDYVIGGGAVVADAVLSLSETLVLRNTELTPLALEESTGGGDE